MSRRKQLLMQARMLKHQEDNAQLKPGQGTTFLTQANDDSQAVAAHIQRLAEQQYSNTFQNNLSNYQND
jgi:hypothetical protein